MATYVKPFTNHGVYNPGSSGLTEAEFRAQRSGNSLAPQNAFTSSQSGNYGGGGQPVGKDDPWGLRGPQTGMAHDPAGSLPGVNSPPLPALTQPGQYYNAGASNALGTPNTWQGDPNLQRISGAMTQMLGFNQGTGQFDTSSGSLLGGPGQGLSRAELAGLSAQGANNVRQNQKNATAGAAMSAAGRGTVGVPMSMLLGPQAQAANRGALASADLDARMKGYDLGNQQYNAKSGVFSNIGSLANAEQNRNIQTQVQDAQDRQQSKHDQYSLLTDAMNNMAAFANQHSTELTSNPGGKNGAAIEQNTRAMLEHLTNLFNNYGANFNRFAM